MSVPRAEGTDCAGRELCETEALPKQEPGAAGLPGPGLLPERAEMLCSYPRCQQRPPGGHLTCRLRQVLRSAPLPASTAGSLDAPLRLRLSGPIIGAKKSLLEDRSWNIAPCGRPRKNGTSRFG